MVTALAVLLGLACLVAYGAILKASSVCRERDYYKERFDDVLRWQTDRVPVQSISASGPIRMVMRSEVSGWDRPVEIVGLEHEGWDIPPEAA